MKIEKLELKHICGYLPYGIRFTAKYENREFTQTLDARRLAYWIENKDSGKLYGKLHLLPLSALTEPLEDGTVPAIEIAKLCDNGHSYDKSKIKKYTSSISIMTDICYDVENVIIRTHYGISVERGGYWVTMPTVQRILEYLYSKHFDIFDLIGSGIAIDKRTVKP